MRADHVAFAVAGIPELARELARGQPGVLWPQAEHVGSLGMHVLRNSGQVKH